ncbi:MAG TPA: EAL domain-containing protein [Vicinamibacteria bacterium]|nr:EAL domain-containing protein [Vicinamibacteria bacterium]
MKLRDKTLLIVAATLLGLTLFLELAAHTLVMAGFDAIEAEAVRENVERARRAVAEEVASLEETTRDYAAWDETYRFVAERHADYLVRHLPTESQAELRVTVVALLDLEGVVIHERLLDFDGRRQLPLPAALSSQFEDERLLYRDPGARRGRAGLLALPEGQWVVASWPILDNRQSGPARGTLVMARPLDAGVARSLAERTRLELELRPLAGERRANAPGGRVETLSEDRIAGHAVLADVHGRPALSLTVRMPRPIHQRARTTVTYLTASVLLVGLIFGGAMVGLIETVVLSRLRRLSARLRTIRESQDLAARVDASGRDELSQLSTTVNDLLAAVETSGRELLAGRERYALAASAANDGLWDWNVPTGEAYYSPRFKSMLGYSEEEVAPVAEAWLSRVHPDDRAELQAKLDSAASETHAEHEHRMVHKDGAYRHVLSRWVTLRAKDGAVQRRVGSLSDVTARKEAEGRLRREALYDALTGLPNRTLLSDRLRQALARARRHPDQVCGLLFLDVDRFKVVNDSLGHAAGDRLLCEVARRIERSVRPEDTVARLGGDEFTVLLEGVRGPKDATHAAERIQAGISRAFHLGDTEVFTTVSIGIAISTGDYQKPEDLIRDADTAMYRAKAAGKARHQLFDSHMHAQAMTMLNLENDLRRALERAELVMHYQPIVQLERPDIVGFEALVRWNHPTRGLVYPGDFIPIAEETGLIVPLGRWVLERACTDARAWQRDFPRDTPLTLSVNLSARQLVEADLLDAVDEILKRTGFDPKSLHLEITESVIMQRPDLVTVVLGGLKDLGIRVSIDDFGTGYSSLSYLHLFPVDSLKIDRSFVSSMQALGKQRRIVETILMLARNLGIDVIAEGVEGEEQRRALHGLGCGLAQGYLFSKPVDEESVRRLLARGGATEAGGASKE